MNPLIISLGYALCWGLGTTLAKLALTEISPTTLLIIQLLASVLFLYALLYSQRQELPPIPKSLKQGIAGIFEPALAYMAGTIGLSLTTASNASLIGSTEVILTILFAALFLKEKLTQTKIILAIVSFIGVFLLIGEASSAATSSILGDLLVLLGTVFAVGYVIFSKTQIAQVSALELTAAQQLVGLLVTVICFGLLGLINPTWEVNAIGISFPYWALAIGSGILQYALAFLLYLTALKTIPVSQAAFFVALIPIFGVASAIVLLGEQPNSLQWLGAACVVVASYSANRLGSENS